MLYWFYLRFLGTQELSSECNKLVSTFIFIVGTSQIIFIVSSTFYVLHVLDLVGFAQLGVLITIVMVTQAILDYPSGVLGDWLGQRWVIVVAYVCYALSFLLLSWAGSFVDLALVYVLMGVGSSQESGAFRTWFDNNYKVLAAGQDGDRGTYKLLFSRVSVIFQVTSSLAFLVGGFLSTWFGRTTVFRWQVVGLTLVAFLTLALVKDHSDVERAVPSLRSYFSLLAEGVAVMGRSRVLLLTILGWIIGSTGLMVWGRLVLMPFYLSYTGSDAGVSIFRYVSWLVGIVMTFPSGWLAKRVSNHVLPWLLVLFTSLFFGGFALLTTFFPMGDNRFQPIPIALTLAIFVLTDTLHITANLLLNSLFVDIIPDRNRNSIYSLIPTLATLIYAPLLIFHGWIISNLGVEFSLALSVVYGFVGGIVMYFGLQTTKVSPLDLEEEVPDRNGDS